MYMIERQLKTTCINISSKEHELLQKEVEETGLSMSAVIRRAIDKYFEDKNDHN